MPFSTQPTVYSLEDDADLFGQEYVDPGPDFFDEYLIFDTDTECSTYPPLSESTGQVKSLSESHSDGTSCSPQDLDLKESTSQNSNIDPWMHPPPEALNRHKSTRSHHVYSEGSGRGSISDTELLSLEGIHLKSPKINPASPSPPASPTKSPGGTLRRTKRFVRSFSKTFAPPQGHRESDCRQRSPIRKSTVPAKMMRASQYNDQNLDEWSQRLAVEAVKFDFGFNQPPMPLSPPPSARVSDSSDNGNGIMATVEDAFSWEHPIPSYAGRLHTPLTTPIPDDHGFHTQNLQQVLTNNMLFQSSDDQSSNVWIQPPGSDFSNFALHTPFVDESESSPLWWSNTASTPIMQPSPAVFHRTPQRNTKSLAMALQNEIAYNATELALSPSALPSGLMIQMPQSPNPQSFVVSSPMHQQPHRHQQQQQPHQGYFGPQHHSSHNIPSSRHRYTQSQPIPLAQQFPQSTMRKSRSRGDLSESPSPTSGLSPGQVPLTPRSASFHVAKRRSASRKHSEASLPKVKASGSGIDFVNFTPHDSMKILTGVAPSGSSKTKARREKEAMDKRRRLSQAAVRAVQAAGGSIESLVEEGLFV